LPSTITAAYDGYNYIFDVICNADNITLKVSSVVLGLEMNTLSNLSLYPNPSNGTFAIDMGREYPDVTVRIYNLTGQIISSEKYASVRIIEGQINNLPGIYFVNVINLSGESTTLRIIKQ
ncbi:MAG: T9SS type A sorting domain-containing protein, partial [Salinivirgaceae bacterium]|nr:T9SS type A sorting domain-containing protein [Salinivirgaceae bacterium]